MKKQFLLGALAVVCTSSFAGTAPDQATAAANELVNSNTELFQLVQINNNMMQLVAAQSARNAMEASAAPDENRFCYLAGKPFSEGAIHDGQTCYRDGIRVMIPGQPPKVDPLRWVSVKQARPEMRAD